MKGVNCFNKKKVIVSACMLFPYGGSLPCLKAPQIG